MGIAYTPMRFEDHFPNVEAIPIFLGLDTNHYYPLKPINGKTWRDVPTHEPGNSMVFPDTAENFVEVASRQYNKKVGVHTLESNGYLNNTISHSYASNTLITNSGGGALDNNDFPSLAQTVSKGKNNPKNKKVPARKASPDLSSTTSKTSTAGSTEGPI